MMYWITPLKFRITLLLTWTNSGVNSPLFRRKSKHALLSAAFLALLVSSPTNAQPDHYVQVIIEFKLKANGKAQNIGWTAAPDGYHVPLVLNYKHLEPELQTIALKLRALSKFSKTKADESVITWFRPDNEKAKRFPSHFLDLAAKDAFNSKHKRELVTKGEESCCFLHRIGLVLFTDKSSIPPR